MFVGYSLQYVALGELLIRCGHLTHAQLERVLEQQRRDFYGSFD